MAFESFFYYGSPLHENWRKIHNEILMLMVYCMATLGTRKLLSVCHIPVPYKVILILLSVPFFIIDHFVAESSKTAFYLLNTRMVSAMLYPLIILKLTYSIDTHLMVRALPQIIMLSTFGLVIFALSVGSALVILSEVENFYFIPLYGFAMAAIDYTEIADELREIESVRFILVILESECVLGIGISFDLMELSIGIYEGFITAWFHGVCILVRYYGGGFIIGFAVSRLIPRIVDSLYNDVLSTLVALFSIIFITYYTANLIFYFSGTFALLIVCLQISAKRYRFSAEVDSTVKFSLDTIFFFIEHFMFLQLTVEACFILQDQLSVGHIFEYLIVYLANLLSRLISVAILLPVLIRAGHGMDIKSVVVIFWLAKKGFIQLHLFSILMCNKKIMDMCVIAMGHTMFYIILNLLMNGGTAKIFLKTFGLTVIKRNRRSNMNNCIKFITNKKDHYLAMIKMNRLLSVVNWVVVDRFTVITHPYNLSIEQDEDAKFIMGNRKSFCSDCRKDIIVEPTKKEIMHMQMETRVRILKSMKISFVRQYEKSFLTSEAMKILLMAIEFAQESKDLVFRVEDVLIHFKKKTMYHRVVEIIDEIGVDPPIRKPRHRCPALCYIFCMNNYYEVSLYLIHIILCIVNAANFERFDVIFGVDICVFCICTADLILKILSHSHVLIRKGFKSYFSKRWHIVEFVLYLLVITVLVLDILILAYGENETEITDIFSIENLAHQIRMIQWAIRFLKVAIIILDNRRKIKIFCQKQIDASLGLAFDMGQACLVSYEEVINILPKITDNRKLMTSIRLQLVKELKLISLELEYLHKYYPHICVTVKSKQAVSSTLQSIKEQVYKLKTNGLIDDFEYYQLTQAIERCTKAIPKLKSVPPKSPKCTFYEVPWIDLSDDITVYLYINSKPITFVPGQYITPEHKLFKGVYVITEGFVRMKYVPERILNHGVLPVKDYISTKDFAKNIDGYAIAGNTLGELSVMSQRSNDTLLICETMTKVYFIPSNILLQAIEFEKGNLRNYYSLIWKHIFLHLAILLMHETQVYKNYSRDYLLSLLERASVPDLEGYSMFAMSERIEDVFVIEGAVEDVLTHEIYIGPCLLPRSARKIYLTPSDSLVPVKLLILPSEEFAKTIKMFDHELYYKNIGRNRSNVNVSNYTVHESKSILKKNGLK